MRLELKTARISGAEWSFEYLPSCEINLWLSTHYFSWPFSDALLAGNFGSITSKLSLAGSSKNCYTPYPFCIFQERCICRRSCDYMHREYSTLSCMWTSHISLTNCCSDIASFESYFVVVCTDAVLLTGWYGSVHHGKVLPINPAELSSWADLFDGLNLIKCRLSFG